jgi:hypothetical protein
MRIWSLHPKYLDSKGLVALWREALLAKTVLQNKTMGYKNHPQLIRFKKSSKPLDCINFYLSIVHKEAENRNYNFDRKKINWDFKKLKLNVTKGQLDFEAIHLMKKLKKRDRKKFKELKFVKSFEPHTIFEVVKGEIEDWEKQ